LFAVVKNVHKMYMLIRRSLDTFAYANAREDVLAGAAHVTGVGAGLADFRSPDPRTSRLNSAIVRYPGVARL
jgi:hypothetical protein